MCSEPFEPQSPSGRADEHDRTLTLLDVVVFAPLGAVLKIPELVEAGRQEYRKKAPAARFLGKMVVEQQRRKRRQRVANLEVPKAAAVVPTPVTVVVEPPQETEPTAPAVPHAETTDASPQSAAELPIEGYDTLAARSILGLLEGLSPAELSKVASHEQQHRQRATILHRIEQLSR